jgi:hypothetical protein
MLPRANQSLQQRSEEATQKIRTSLWKSSTSFDIYIKCLDVINVKPVRLPAQPCFKRRDAPAAGPAPRRGLSTRIWRRLARKFKSTSGRRLAGKPQPGEVHLRPRPAARRAAQQPPTGRRGDARKLRS